MTDANRRAVKLSSHRRANPSSDWGHNYSSLSIAGNAVRRPPVFGLQNNFPSMCLGDVSAGGIYDLRLHFPMLIITFGFPIAHGLTLNLGIWVQLRRVDYDFKKRERLFIFFVKLNIESMCLPSIETEKILLLCWMLGAVCVKCTAILIVFKATQCSFSSVKWPLQNHFYNPLTCNGEKGGPVIDPAHLFSLASDYTPLGACLGNWKLSGPLLGYSAFFFSFSYPHLWSCGTEEPASFLRPGERRRCWHVKCCRKKKLFCHFKKSRTTT